MTRYMIMGTDERNNDIVLCVECYHRTREEKRANVYIDNTWVCEDCAEKKRFEDYGVTG
jgi:hypothetical protein